MSFGPDPPAPVNPYATAAAQTSTNVSTALANAFLNNMNQVTPTGSLSYDVNDYYNFTDPTSGASYQIPRFTVTQNLSPQEQQILNTNEQSKLNLANLAQSQSSRLNNVLGQPFNLNGAPAAGSVNGFNNLGAPQSTIADAGPLTMNLGNYGQQQTTFANTNPLSTTFGNTAQPTQYTFGDAGNVLTGYNTGQPVQTTFGDAGNITRSYGPADDFSSDRGRVEEALYGRLNPQLDRERANLEQRLADQGIRYGSPAYQKAMDDYNRQANDARLAVTQTAGQEQQRMMDMAAQRAGFENAAQQQAYTQAQGRGMFYNAAQAQQYAQNQQLAQFTNAAQNQLFSQMRDRGLFANQAQAQEFAQALARGQYSNDALQKIFEQAQARGVFANEAQANAFQQALNAATFANTAQQTQFQENAARGSFTNAALAQQLAMEQAKFGAANTARANYLQEQYAARNQPINEVTALMSGSQVTNPNFVNTQQTQIPTTDIAGLINANFNQQMDVFKQNSANQNALLGGLLGLGGNIIKSDVREKENITRMGTVFAADDEDARRALPIYQYSYKDDPSSTTHIGPMAQDVEKIDPGAVRTIRGVKHIDRSRVMGGILRVA